MSTGTDLGSVPRFSSREPEEQYRPIAPMAVVSLGLGILSILAFGGPAFWFLPAIAFIISGITSYRLERAKHEYAGQVLAKAGLLISLIAGAGAVTQHYVRWGILRSEALEEANNFLDDLLTNRAPDAFFLTNPPISRVGLEGSPEDLISRNKQAYRDFLRKPIVKELGGKLDQTQVTLLETVPVGQERGYDVIFVRYALEVGDNVLECSLQLQGSVAYSGEWSGRQWYVSATHLVPKSEAPKP
ncbi:hypothetical protein Pan216_46630 [Planctomycetes bacterium Pan216]|uniref:DUF4190 domain-containing protein n=1 Tax=Kolteria novifilia TaxID=2527975 RepID=A0A518B9X0_9BACT|nr:hypothetical protein Pan216_46630 [Planctomycetes bacterium Pan216]